MRFSVALRAFFRALFDAAVARRIEAVLDGGESTPPEQTQPQVAQERVAQERAKPSRSEAITLLATLQREARLLDFLRESLGDYSDAQIGAAVRDIHRDAAAAVERMFAIEAVVDGEEGRAVEVPVGFDAGCYRLSGNVTGEPPFRGTVVHHGWRATKCELPAWSGAASAADIVAAAEVELK